MQKELKKRSKSIETCVILRSFLKLKFEKPSSQVVILVYILGSILNSADLPARVLHSQQTSSLHKSTHNFQETFPKSLCATIVNSPKTEEITFCQKSFRKTKEVVILSFFTSVFFEENQIWIFIWWFQDESRWKFFLSNGVFFWVH